jgi:two-component system cell cycle sensor histidine kinase/response regulator CckA
MEQLAAMAAALCAAPVSVITAAGREIARHPPDSRSDEGFAAALAETWPGAAETITVLDRAPREWSETERLALRVLARQADLLQRNRDLAETARIAAVGKWRSEAATGELRWCSTVYEIFGLAVGTPVTYSTFLAALHPEDRAQAAERHRRALQGEPLHWEHRVQRPDGTLRWVVENGELIRDAAGQPWYLAGTVQDVTERRVLSNEIEKLFAISNDLICIASQDGYFQRVNPAFERVLGWTPEEMVAHSFLDFVVEADRERTTQALGRLISGGTPVPFENRFRKKCGGVCRLSWSSMPLGEDGTIYGIARDVTAERGLAERLQETLEATTDAFLSFDAEWRFSYVNAEAERLLGRDRTTLLGRNVWEEYPAAKERASYRAYLQAVAERVPVRFEEHVEGQDRWLDVRVFPTSQGLDVYLRDVTEARRANRELQEIAGRYQLLFDRNPLPMWVFDLETLEFLAVNQATIAKYEYSREEFLAMNLRDIRPPEEVAKLEAQVAHPPDGLEEAGYWKHRTKSGRLLTMEIYNDRIPFAGRRARLVLAVDVTERLVLEQQLRQAQKMETIGKLAGGIAHDFNNLLTVINGYAQVLQRRFAAEEAVARPLGHILQSGERAAALTAQLLAFSRQQVLQPKTVAMNALVEAMKPMLERLIREDVEVAWWPGADTGNVRIDPSQFEQVILNLAINARDAMPMGGRLTIETGRAILTPEYARQHPEVTPGEYALLSVSDTGQGMPAEVLQRVFDPFFTTKATGAGTGLGLATVYGIVKQSGGHISVYSEVGVGSRFKVYLPAAEGEAAPAESAEDLGDDLRGTETILLVEDDEAVREYASGVLRELGYEVIEVADGPDAIVASERYAGEIQLLLTDVVMPKLNGRDLAEFLCERRPGLRVLFVSGYTENSIVHQGVLDEGLHFLAKPFSPGALAQKVRSVLTAETKPCRVLLVDDEACVRELLRETLTAAGYEVVLCENGAKAIARLAEEPMDLLITDLVMPGQEGIETIAQARREYPQLKILAISGFSGGEYLRMAKVLGANETLAKPLDLTLLTERVRALTRRGIRRP